MRLPDADRGRSKKRLTEGGDPELNLLYWLFVNKNIPPWAFYERSQGYRDLVEAMALQEIEDRREARLQRE